MRPLIGILTNILKIDQNPERIYVNRDYVNCILRAGGIPFLLPILEDQEVILRQIQHVDGILLSGGQDVHPKYYNEDASHLLGDVCPDRDLYEMAAIKYASSLKKPLFGVCRGLQLLNIAHGGTLLQDIPHEFPTSVLQHRQTAKREEGTHEIEIVEPSKLFEILGHQKLITNSFHHQAVKELAPGFKISARSSDGIIEAIEMASNHFVLGVQWHPEAMAEKNPSMQKLFDAFVHEAKHGR